MTGEIEGMTTKERSRAREWGGFVPALQRQGRTLWPVMLLIYAPLAIAFGIVSWSAYFVHVSAHRLGSGDDRNQDASESAVP